MTTKLGPIDSELEARINKLLSIENLLGLPPPPPPKPKPKLVVASDAELSLEAMRLRFERACERLMIAEKRCVKEWISEARSRDVARQERDQLAWQQRIDAWVEDQRRIEAHERYMERYLDPTNSGIYQAGGLASVQATEDVIRASPNCYVLIDEFGRWLRMILEGANNVRELPGTLCKFWAIRPGGSWTITRRAREEVTNISIDWPALAFAGCTVGEIFWDACGDDEIAGGFLNRCVIFDAGLGGPRAKPKYSWEELPAWLAQALKERAGVPASNTASVITKTQGLLGPRRLTWGAGAEGMWEREVDTIRVLPEGRKRDIFARAPEIAVRLATTVAWWRGSEVVEVADWEWGWALAELSCQLVLKGANENMKVKREFDKICAHIKALLAAGPKKIGEIHVHSRSAAGNQGMEIIDKALDDLKLSEEISELSRDEQEKLGLALVGRPTRWFQLA
jgi:hypothetical protein